MPSGFDALIHLPTVILKWRIGNDEGTLYGQSCVLAAATRCQRLAYMVTELKCLSEASGSMEDPMAKMHAEGAQ